MLILYKLCTCKCSQDYQLDFIGLSEFHEILNISKGIDVD